MLMKRPILALSILIILGTFLPNAKAQTNMPTATPLTSDKLKDIAMLVNSPKAEWLRSLGEPDRDLPPGNTLPWGRGRN